MAFVATYTVTLSASDKDHAWGEYVYASIVRNSPATLAPEGLYVQSATIIAFLLHLILLRQWAVRICFSPDPPE